MKLFLDTGNLDEIEKWVGLGIIDGVTTNPSLVAKEGGDPRELYKAICRLVKGPVSAEVIATEADGMIREARELSRIADNIVVKLPFGTNGVKACKALADEGIRVNMTLVFSASQALLTAKAGASFVSPFIGRLDDISTDGLDLIEQILDIYENYEFPTEVLVASVRHPMHVVEAARLGADICTCPPAVIASMFRHPLTDVGLARFLDDWKKASRATT